jgi:GNAT superfamily N-acetyltransferase
MAEFPTTFAETPHYIHPTEIPAHLAEPFIALKQKGFIMVAGITPANVEDLAEIANQEGVLEYCPNDIAKRWTDIPTAEKQLAKDGGRGVFRTEHVHTGDTAAFGWTGKSSDEERGFLPECENTFALRANEDYRGQGLGKLVSRAIVVGSMYFYGAKRIGLETWASNTTAVRSYLGAGAVLKTTQDSMRLTRIPEQQDANGMRRDVRLYMQYPWSM